MSYCTPKFIRALKKETLEACILETHAHIDLDERLKWEIKSMLFHYLKKHTLTRELTPVCKALIKSNDLEDLKTVNEYNYNKLKLII